MSEIRPDILIVEDDLVSRRVLERALETEGFQPFPVQSCREALASVRSRSFAAVLLDLNLPDGSGFDVCRGIREHSNMPVIIISVRGAVDDVIHGLEIGADDYVVKPFDVRVVLARIKAQVRRATILQDEPGRHRVFGSLVVDFGTHEVLVRGKRAGLTCKEFEFVSILAGAAGRPVRHAAICDSLWSESEERAESILTVYARKVRRKIEDDPDNPRRLLTVRGVGYRLAGVD